VLCPFHTVWSASKHHDLSGRHVTFIRLHFRTSSEPLSFRLYITVGWVCFKTSRLLGRDIKFATLQFITWLKPGRCHYPVGFEASRTFG
jgi:predicted membrane channel-forming protein YqfA (hemolysin III family)